MKTVSLAAVALSGALALSACGNPTAPSSSTSTTSTSSAAGAALKPGDTVDGAALAMRMTAAMVKAGSGSITMDLAAIGKVSGSFVISSGSMQQQMAMTIQGQAMQIVSTGGLIYMKGLPGSAKPWVKIDPKAKDAVSKMFAGLTGNMGDPRQLAKVLQGTKAKVVSTSATATQYDVTIDPSKLAGTTGQSAAPSVGLVKARYTLDAQDRPTEMDVVAGGQDVKVTFGGWGTPVTIQTPPADQVGSFQVPAG
ncbi:hypothetical protein [Pedococcus sp.]|uniref:hypothetical protein n=1 Tax=Pedococcus sp. TaxID=2860345 RepID=UPI002E164E09|nr:hypothetical protein [Pedococcus sp.]